MTKTTEDYIKEVEEYGAKNYSPIPVVLEKAEGVFVWDVEGKKYFDMLSAYSAVNQGHQHPRIIKAAQSQMIKLALTSRAFHNNMLGVFLKKICELTDMEKALTMNSGAEAVETAIKAMRKYGYEKRGIENNKAEIIVAENNFHGRTTTIVGFSSDKISTDGFGPATPGFVKIPYDDVDALRNAINENTVGFLVEPIQGEAGVIVPKDNYLKEVRKICDEKNILLCLDEIQTGLGRTGKLWCFEHENVKPDIVIMGKALSGGLYPISAIACSNEIMSVFTPGTHGSTYGGNPLACAIGIEALNVIIEENLPKKSEELGEYFINKLKENLSDNPKIKDIRGKGLLIAVEMNENIAKKLCIDMSKEGILVKDTHETTIRFAPPLIITKEQIDEVLINIKKVFDNL